MTRYLCVLLMVSIVAISCKKSTEAPVQVDGEVYQEYIIPKGNHYAAQNEYRSIRIKQLKFSVLFDSSCIYTTAKASNSGDVNKLYGFSDCSSQHHQNSARFGWRWNGKSLEIFAYCYTNSVREMRSLGSIEIGKPVDMSIQLTASHYVFEMNGKTVQMPRNCSGEYADGYQLYPYFGGDETAPHDIRILIKERAN